MSFRHVYNRIQVAFHIFLILLLAVIHLVLRISSSYPASVISLCESRKNKALENSSYISFKEGK